MDNTDQITTIIEELKNSPMFNLSLSSKELFHSNFLYWLGTCEKTKKLFEYVILKLSGKDGFDWPFEKACVKREKTIENKKDKFDLSIEDESGELKVVIENKVKTLPNLSQLERYQSKIERKQGKGSCSLILLSLFHTERDTGDWKKRSYKELADALNDKTNEFVNDLRCKTVINDYICCITNLHKIAELTKIKEGEPYSSYKDTTTYKELEAVRLEDFFIKAKYAQIVEKICRRLAGIKPNGNELIVKQNFSVEMAMDEKEQVGTVYVSSGFDNGTGSAGVMIRAKDFAYTIGVQGDEYRRGCLKVKKIDTNVAFDTKDKQAWVDFNTERKDKPSLDISPPPAPPDQKDPNPNSYPSYPYYPFRGMEDPKEKYSARYKAIKVSQTDKTDNIFTVNQLINEIMKDVKECLKFIGIIDNKKR